MIGDRELIKDILLSFYLDDTDLKEYKMGHYNDLYQSSSVETPESLRERKEHLDKCLNDIKAKFIHASNYEYTLLYDTLTEPILAEIKRINYKLGDGLRTVDNALPQVKQIPIRHVLDNYGVKVYNQYGNRLRFAIRDERTASCTAYIDQNSWWDYGSSTGGSVIDLVMQIEQCSISEAIKKLKTML